MKLTKQIGKNVLVCMLALTSMTGMVFASGAREVTTSPVISSNTAWQGVIDGIAIDLAYDENAGSIAGTVTNLVNNDISNAHISIKTAKDETITSLILGVPGTYEIGDVVVKENTTILAKGASVPVIFYLDESQVDDLFTNGWKVSFDSDNAPKYGLLEMGELLVQDAKNLSEAFVITENGVQTVVIFSDEDEGFLGTITNYTNKTVGAVETSIALNNGTIFKFNAKDIKSGETKSFFFEASSDSGETGFSKYAVEAIVK